MNEEIIIHSEDVVVTTDENEQLGEHWPGNSHARRRLEAMSKALD